MAGNGSTQVKETPAQIALAEHAAAVMKDYKQRWLPVQKNLASQIENEGAANSQQRREATGKATTDTAIQFDNAQGAMSKAMTNSGAAPGSGRFDMATMGMGTDQAKSSGLGRMISDQQITDAYTQGLTALMMTGQGESAMVGQGLASQAQASGMQAEADARASMMDRMSMEGAAGTAVGMGMQQWMKPATGNGLGINTGTAILPDSLRGGGMGYTG